MRVLVTGGAGFIGSHLCEALLDRGHRVVCYDNYLTGKPENVAHLDGRSDFDLIEADVRETIPEAEYDFIYHLASPASPADYARMPVETLLINAAGTRHVLDLAAKTGARLFIASTSEVYGDPRESPQHEDYWGHVNPVGIRSCYDEGKRFAEALAAAYHRRHDLDICVGRLFNTFGSRMRVDDGRAVPNFINQALSGRPLTVYGDGSQTRSFCFIDDMVGALLLAADRMPPGLFIVNLGNDEEMSVLALAEKVKEMCQSEAPIVFEPLPPDDPTQRRPRLDRAKTVLGYEPSVTLAEGLEKVVDWFIAQRGVVRKS